MKKFFLILFIIILLIGIVWKVFFTPCKLEKTKVHQIARPIVKAFAEHIDKHGVPESLDDVQGIKHKLISCKGNKKVEGCNGYEDRRYFEYANEQYCIFLSGTRSKYRRALYFEVIHNNTACTYFIYRKNLKTNEEVVPMYIGKPRCGTTCKTWWRM